MRRIFKLSMLIPCSPLIVVGAVAWVIFHGLHVGWETAESFWKD